MSVRSVLRLRMSSHDAHYGGNLVDGARMLALFGDVATELCILHDGDEGLFRAYDSVEFLALFTPGTSSRRKGRSPRSGEPAGRCASRRGGGPSAARRVLVRRRGPRGATGSSPGHRHLRGAAGQAARKR